MQLIILQSKHSRTKNEVAIRKLPSAALQNLVLSELPQLNVRYCTVLKSNHLKSKNSLPTLEVIAQTHQVPSELYHISSIWTKLYSHIPGTSPFYLVVGIEEKKRLALTGHTTETSGASICNQNKLKIVGGKRKL